MAKKDRMAKKKTAKEHTKTQQGAAKKMGSGGMGQALTKATDRTAAMIREIEKLSKN